MLICDDPPFVFVSTPRSGTHAMYKFLADRYGLELPDPANYHPRHVPGDKQSHFTFTTVRNPYRRAVSAWWMLTRRPEYWVDWQCVWKDQAFEHVLHWMTMVKPGFPGKGANVLWPQSQWLAPVRLDAVVHIEMAGADFFNLPINPGFAGGTNRIPRLGVDYKPTTGNYGYWRQHYTPETIELVQQIYADDFERFGYSMNVEDAGDVG